MKEQNLTTLYEEADEALHRAREILYQPAEDVVNYSVCVSARKALYNFLTCLSRAYEEEHGKEESLSGENPTMEQLIEYCSRYNDRVKALDFSSIYCRYLGELNNQPDPEQLFYCNDVFKVKACTSIAESVKKAVEEKYGR